ncbi:MAG: hypothetical protein JWO48_1633 [Bryobacterales bacterium]|nr:hypothetical protein [Bryobacterales bacterium]
MKLRIKGNSIRLRLGQSEVLRLAINGTVEESTTLGPFEEQHFGYAVHASPSVRNVSASLMGRRLVIRVPWTVIHEWVTTDQVSINALQDTGENGNLRILIEKDFECVDPAPGELQEDAFPHPQFGSACLPQSAIERPA